MPLRFGRRSVARHGDTLKYKSAAECEFRLARKALVNEGLRTQVERIEKPWDIRLISHSTQIIRLTTYRIAELVNAFDSSH